LNGDVNDNYELGSSIAQNNADCVANAGGDADEHCSGALNSSNTKQKGYGFNAQLAFNQPIAQKQNQLIVGGGYDHSKVRFDSMTEFGILNDLRTVETEGHEDDEVELHGRTKTYSLFATDTLSLNDFVHLTASGRYTHTNVNNVDQLVTSGPASLTGNHSFERLNPAVGLSFTPSKDLAIYGAYNEGMRAPTSMELGCANPAQPCKLPNAMAGDPPLEKVVAKTFEAGMRGNLTPDVKWSTAVYRTENHNDIHFIATNMANGMGYFDNVGKTRRQGLDAALAGRAGKFSWNTGYSYLKATYQNNLDLLSPVNSSANETLNDGITDGSIQVSKGDRLPNLPSHAFKMRMQYAMTPNWTLGSNINAFSSVYVRGNENNAHEANDGELDEHVQSSGKVSGYAVVNLDTRYKLNNSGWQLFAKANNVFNKKYATGGMLGENWIEDGVFNGGEEPSKLLMLGAPRAAWVGVRYDFGKPKGTAANVDAD
jgi:outer membrane receptor protein involved in Fe transport